MRDASQGDALSKLSRYAAMINRDWYRALHELERIQSQRQGVPVPPPVVADFNIELGSS
jgi:hypothetical protein